MSPAMMPACSAPSPSVADTVSACWGCELDRQRAEAQGHGEGLGLVLGERARDLDLVALEAGLVDRRGGEHLAVEHDGEPALAAGGWAGHVGCAGEALGRDLVEHVDAVRARLERPG